MIFKPALWLLAIMGLIGLCLATLGFSRSKRQIHIATREMKQALDYSRIANDTLSHHFIQQQLELHARESTRRFRRACLHACYSTIGLLIFMYALLTISFEMAAS